MIKLGPVYQLSPRVEIKEEICEYCRFARARKVNGDEKIICAKGSPKLDMETSIAMWPIVEPTNHCGEFRFNNG